MSIRRAMVAIQLLARYHPVFFLLGIAVSAGSLFLVLEQFTWGWVINAFVLTMISSEAGAWKWFAHGCSPRFVSVVLVAANLANLLLDWLLAAELLHLPRIVALTNLINSTVLQLWRRCLSLMRGQSNDRQEAPPIEQVKAVVKGYSHWHLLVLVVILSALPRVATVVVGGTAIAIFLVKYKQLGWRGWAAVFLGTTIRIGYIILFYQFFY